MLTLWASCYTDPLSCCAAEQTKAISSLWINSLLALLGEDWVLTMKLLISFFLSFFSAVGQIQPLVMATISTVEFKVIKGKFWIVV